MRPLTLYIIAKGLLGQANNRFSWNCFFYLIRCILHPKTKKTLNCMQKYLILILFFTFSLKAETTVNISNELKKIPIEECEKIHSFFYKMIRHFGFGYTLFGHTPVSTTCWLTVPDYNKKRPYFSVDEEFVEAYKVWKKHSHKFPSKKFILSERSLFAGTEYTNLILIKKSEFDKKVRLHPTYFPGDYDVNSFIKNEIVKNYRRDGSEIDGYHIRMGILLGYGIENAKEFTKRIKKQSRDKNDPDWILFKDLIKAERKKNEPFPSVFLVNPNTQETNDLLTEFIPIQEKLCGILNDENFLQIVLEEYCSIKDY
jgi:hypothetical protein